MFNRVLTLMIVALLLGGCARESTPVTELKSPAAPDSGEPGFTHMEGSLVLSWVQATPKGHALLYSRLGPDGSFGPPLEAAAGADWFVNWADRPSVVGGNEGLVAAHWLAKSDGATFAYDVWVKVSRDQGATWSEPVRPHGDGTRTEHGFVSLMPAQDGFRLVWLDGRRTGGGHDQPAGPMTLRSAFLDQDGRVVDERLVDDRVCDCCPTAGITQKGTQVVAYRDRSPAEVRDIFLTRFEGDAWSDPVAVHNDDWTIPGCPVNGPALAGGEDRIACLWFTEVQDTAKVSVAVSEDQGRTFGDPVRVNAGVPLGRVDIQAIQDGLFLLLWMEEGEAPAGEGALIQARVLFPSGLLGDVETLVATQDSRAVGFPKLARQGNDFYITWTEPGASANQVRVIRWSPGWMQS